MSFADLENAPAWLQTMLGLLVLAGAAAIANLALKVVLTRITRSVLTKLSMPTGSVEPVVRRLANAVPALIIHLGVQFIPHIPEAAMAVTRNVCSAFIILTLALAAGGALNLVNQLYQRRPDAKSRPIKGYLQLVKILLYSASLILVVAALMERSPLLLFSGLGALAAVLMLVFKDTILSLVASVQLTSNDMLRVGDWIEMPQLNADGDVIDIALHTVKVQNWDKTITTIPTYRLINESYKNWRGMQESGGRRIKRALMIDQSSVAFLTDCQRENLGRFALIKAYLTAKEAELRQWNSGLDPALRDPANERRSTNIGTFRAYVTAYVAAHPRIAQSKTRLVRQLQPTPQGLPIEIYCFTDTIAWAAYEDIQGDIFDHLIAILPEFGLSLFQEPSGRDVRAGLTSRKLEA
jgi:miniconductance mechanosensitive channel